MKRIRASRSVEQKAESKLRDKLRKQKSRASQSLCQRVALRLLDKCRKRYARAHRPQVTNDIVSRYIKAIKDGPTYICNVCYRLLYRRSVNKIKKEKYIKMI